MSLDLVSSVEQAWDPEDCARSAASDVPGNFVGLAIHNDGRAMAVPPSADDSRAGGN